MVSSVQGHDHLPPVDVIMGPLILRVTVLAAMSVVAGCVLLRPFLTEPGHRTPVFGVGAAGIAVSFELLLSGGLWFPEQLVPLLLAGVAVPLYLLLSSDPRSTRATALGRSLASPLFVAMAVFSTVVLCRAWFADMPPRATATMLHTGVVLTLVALAWSVVAPCQVAVRVLGAVMASASIPATAQALMS